MNKIIIIDDTNFEKELERFFKSNDILRIEAHGSGCRLYQSNGMIIDINSCIEEMELQLKDFSFIRVHKNHILNLNYISNIKGKPIEFIKMTNGESIPVDNDHSEQITGIITKYIY